MLARRLFPCLVSALLLAACGDTPEEAPLPEREVLPCEAETQPAADEGVCPPGGSPEAGLTAFRTACAQCHVRSDGWDLAHFGFSDASIVRRASAHVDAATACNIVAWVRSMDVPRKGPGHRPFRPGCAVASDDAAFGRQLFAGDLWPVDLTREQLLARHPREVATAMPMLPWSDEGSRTDWMPEQPLPESLLAEQDGALRAAIDAYEQERTTERLLHAVAVFGELTEGPEGSGRICEGVDGFHTTPEPCFQVRKWMAALAGQHVLRFGLEDRVPGPVVDLWWGVGAAEATISSRNHPIRHIHAPSGAVWMYLSWSLDPLRQRTLPFYFPELTKDAGYPRHAAYSMFYSAALASEGPDVERVYALVVNGYIRTPQHWLYDALTWSLNLLRTNHEAGLRPPTPEGRARARTQLQSLRAGITEGGFHYDKLSSAQRSKLYALYDEVIAGLQD